MIYDQDGQRKYLNRAQRAAFLQICYKRGGLEGAFCSTIALTGCRVSEALDLRQSGVDRNSATLIFRTLKKRSVEPVYRAVPVPEHHIETLDLYLRSMECNDRARIWSWSRTKAWLVVKKMMRDAGITGTCANPKGLRHGFGIAAVQSGIPLNMVQKWLGHSRLETTAIYTNALGPEERSLAARLWEPHNQEKPQC